MDEIYNTGRSIDTSNFAPHSVRSLVVHVSRVNLNPLLVPDIRQPLQSFKIHVNLLLLVRNHSLNL